jgi:hypothetical protein
MGRIAAVKATALSQQLLACEYFSFPIIMKVPFYEIWWAHLESNQGPTGYEPVALPIEL